ncbi:hypothetical protein [Nocardia grenadensis]
MFGPDEDYLTTWNAMICAFQLKESSLRGGAALGAALLEHPDDLAAALDAWETGLRPFVTKHQRTARLEQQMFVPSSRRAEALRSVLLGLIRRIRGRRPVAEAGGPRTRVCPARRGENGGDRSATQGFRLRPPRVVRRPAGVAVGREGDPGAVHAGR